MKPIRLKLQAFGSFPGAEEVDFEALAARGLFVVGGDTGTGKTTIFDAMCWVLYGHMPLKEAGGVRSDHAGAGTETVVELTFECEGARYVVTRRPEHLRPKKKGGGMTTEPASAGLVRLTADGSEPVSTKANETSSWCAALVGLDARQFQRVVLLPQGEFSRFLLASTDEREKLLGKLFGGRVFDDMVEHLKNRRSELGSGVTGAEAEIKAQLVGSRVQLAHAHVALGIDVPESLPHVSGVDGLVGEGAAGDHDAPGSDAEDRSGDEDVPEAEALEDLCLADRDLVGQLRDDLSEPLEELRARVDELKREADAATRAHNDAEGAAGRFDQTLKHLQILGGLDAEREAVTVGEAAANASRAARPVVKEARGRDGALEKHTAAMQARDVRMRAITAAFAELGLEVDAASAADVTTTLGHEQVRHKTDADLLTAQATAVVGLKAAEAAYNKAGTDLEAKVEDRDVAFTRATRIAEVELPELRKGSTDPEVIDQRLEAVTLSITRRQSLESIEQALGEARRTQESATTEYNRVFKAFVASEAPRLAESLTEGEPCPVCGSVAHPSPALNGGGRSATSEDLQVSAAARQAADEAVGDLVVQLTGARTELGDDADASVDDLKVRESLLLEALDNANRMARRIGDLATEFEHASTRVVELDKEIVGLGVTRANAQTQLDEADRLLCEAREVADGIDPAEVAERTDSLGRIAEHAEGLDSLFNAVVTASNSMAEAERRVSDALDESPFETVSDATDALLSSEQEAQALAVAQNHRDRRSDSEAALRLLSGQGVPGDRPDLVATKNAALTAGAIHGDRSEACTTATNARTYCDDALEEYDRIESDTASVRARYEQADRAYVVCRNGGALEMSLKRWVLTRELDRVTVTANVHLRHMTAHRYSLHRRSEVTDRRKNSGLDLEVLDATTGRARSTTSLSGGEQFQASLALALGLADVVSHGGSASGKRFEALFVDEGFGSLDPRSLEDAIEALHQLHATGRMVGAITHVEAMKQQLHVGIEVTRLPDGGGSTLSVHP